MTSLTGPDVPARPHIAIIGLMGAGKSTLAEAISGHLKWPMRDSDADIQLLTGRTGREIAATDGVDPLHRLEEAVLLGVLAGPEPTVVTAAGWTVDSEVCRFALKRRAMVVWLDITVDDVMVRMATGHHRRSMSRPEVESISARRRPLMQELADVTLDARLAEPELLAAVAAALPTLD